MGSIANLFDKNIRKVDAKKCVFCPKCKLCKGGWGGGGGGGERGGYHYFYANQSFLVLPFILSVWCVYVSALFIYTSFNVTR